jgi:hypothetical protein
MRFADIELVLYLSDAAQSGELGRQLITMKGEQTWEK